MHHFSSSSDETKEDFSEMDDLLNTNIRLAQDNERLKETVQKLKSEQNEALEFATKNQEFIVIISDLKMKLKESISEKIELQNRLEITLKSYEQLKEQLKENKEECKTEDSLNLSKILQNEKNRLQQQIDEIKSDLTSKNEALKSLQSDNSLLHESINKILKLSSISFQTNFENETDLISFLSSYHPENHDDTYNEIPNKTNANEKNVDQNQQYLVDQRIIKKITKLKKQLKTEKENYQLLQEELENAKSNNEKIQKSYIQQNNKIREELQEEKHKSALMEIQHQAEIEKYKQENKRYFDQINSYQSLKTKTTLISQIGDGTSQALNDLEKERIQQENNSLRSNLNQLNKQISELRETNLNLRAQNNSILTKFKTIESQNDTYKNKLDKQKTEIHSLSKNVDQFKSENQTLLLEISQLQEQLGAGNTKLSTCLLDNQQLKMEVDRLNLQIANYNKSISILEDNYQKQKCETQEVFAYRDKLTNLVRKQNDYFKEFHNTYQRVIQENNELKANIKTAESKLRQTQEEYQRNGGTLDSNAFPISVWYNKGFPRDLCTKITDIVKKDSIDNQTKLKNVLNEIMSFYSNQIKTIQGELSNQQNQYSKEHDVIESFFANLGSLLDINLTTQVLLHDSSINERITKAINDLKSVQYEISNSKAKIETNLSEILTKLDVHSVEEGKEMIQKLYSNIELMQSEQIEYKNTQSKLKKIIKELKKESKQNSLHLQSNIDEKEKENEALNQEKRDLIEKIRSLKQRIVQMEIQNKTDNENSLQQVDHIKAENEYEIQSIKDSYEQRIRKLQIENEQKEKDIRKLQDNINHLEQQNDLWKHSSESFDALKKQNEKQVKELMEQYERNETEMRNSHLLEKKALREQYEKCLENIKQQNKDIQESNEKTTQQLQESNSKVNELNQKLSLSENIIIDLKSRLQTQKEELERERNLIEIRTKSSLLAQEIKFHNAIDENKLNYQSEKRKIYEFIANLFSEYCDVKNDIDEFAFKSILQMVRKDLSQLTRDEKTIRTILSISDRESLPDAISKLVLNIFQSDD